MAGKNVDSIKVSQYVNQMRQDLKDLFGNKQAPSQPVVTQPANELTALTN